MNNSECKVVDSEALLRAIEGAPLSWTVMTAVLQAASFGEWCGTVWQDTKGEEVMGLYKIQRVKR